MSDTSLALLPSATLFCGVLSARAVELFSDAELPNESRANLAIKSLEFLRLERKLMTAGLDGEPNSPDPARDSIVQRFEQACDYIDATDDEKERFYLRRLLVEEGTKLSSLRGEFYLESSLDATLDQIEDGEERQKAICAYASFYARRLAFHIDENEMGRVRLNGLIDEIDDLNDYENLIAEATASAFFGLAPDFSDPVSVFKSIEGVETLGQKVEKFETFEASFKLEDEIPAQIVEDLNFPPAADLLRRLSFKAIKTLYELGGSIEGARPRGVKDDSEEYEKLDEDDVQELRNVARNLVLTSPFVLEHGDRLRPFFVLYRSLNAFEPVFQRLREALDTLDADKNDPDYQLKRAYYQHDKEYYQKELENYLMALTFLIIEKAPDDPFEKVRCVALLARLTFVYGGENADAVRFAQEAVLESFSIIPKIENVCDRVACWRMLTEAHFDGTKRKPLKKLASLIVKEIDSIDSELTRDNEKSKAFPVLARICDAEKITAFASSFVSESARVEHVAKAKICQAFQEFEKEQDSNKFSLALASCAYALVKETQELDPLIATEIFLQVARFLDDRLEFQLNPNKIRIPKYF